jgi:hypothetical protein
MDCDLAVQAFAESRRQYAGRPIESARNVAGRQASRGSPRRLLCCRRGKFWGYVHFASTPSTSNPLPLLHFHPSPTALQSTQLLLHRHPRIPPQEKPPKILQTRWPQTSYVAAPDGLTLFHPQFLRATVLPLIMPRKPHVSRQFLATAQVLPGISRAPWCWRKTPPQRAFFRCPDPLGRLHLSFPAAIIMVQGAL